MYFQIMEHRQANVLFMKYRQAFKYWLSHVVKSRWNTTKIRRIFRPES